MNDGAPALRESNRIDAAEVGSVARELATAYRSAVVFYRDQMKLPLAEAEERARGAEPGADLDWDRRLALDEPADRVSWLTISHLAERDPDAAMAAWTRIKAEAANELATGHRTAQ